MPWNIYDGEDPGDDERNGQRKKKVAIKFRAKRTFSRPKKVGGKKNARGGKSEKKSNSVNFDKVLSIMDSVLYLRSFSFLNY